MAEFQTQSRFLGGLNCHARPALALRPEARAAQKGLTLGGQFLESLSLQAKPAPAQGADDVWAGPLGIRLFSSPFGQLRTQARRAQNRPASPPKIIETLSRP